MGSEPSNQEPGKPGWWRRGGRGRWRWIVLALGLLALGLWWMGSPGPVRRMVNGQDLGRLLQGMASGDPAVRGNALQDLTALGTNSVPALLAAADQRDPWTRAVFDRLSPSLSPRHREWLRRWWRPQAALIERQQAVSALGAMTNTPALTPVWGRLLRHPDRNVANQAWAKLREAGPAGVEFWRAGLRDSDLYVRTLAASGLTGLGAAAGAALPELRLALQDPDLSLRRNALSVLLALEAQAWPDLVRLGSNPKDPLRSRAIAGIVASPSATRSNVVQVLAWAGDPDATVRRVALVGLAWVRPWTPDIEAAVTRECRSGDVSLRLAALQTIGRAGRRASGLRAVALACCDDPDASVRAAATNVVRVLDSFPLDSPASGLKTPRHALDVPQDRPTAPVPAVGGVDP